MSVTKKLKNIPLIWILVLSLSIALGGFFIGNGVYKSMARRTVTVKGLAERDVVADTAIWNVKFNAVGVDLADIQNAIDEDIQKTRVFLMDKGFKETEIQNLRVQVRDKFAGYSAEERDSQSNKDRYVIETGVMVRSNNVQLVDAASRKMGELVKQGVTITEDYTGPLYIFNGLNEIKIQMIEDATKNATSAGEQFAKDANARLGKIQSANQGVFSITARDPIDAWSDNEKQSINKRVRVVSTITFYLK